MRLAGVLVTVLIFAFWATMNVLVVRRQVELRSQDRYKVAVTRFLGSDLLRERWMGIYKKNKKIGYTGYVFEKVFAEEGVEIRSTLESRMDVQLFGQNLPVRLNGSLLLDGDLKPKLLRLEVLVRDGLPLTIVGKADGEEFAVAIEQGATTILRTTLPREELLLGDGLVPSLPVSGLEVGDEFSVPCFDPATMGRALARVKVVARETKDVSGVLTDVFELETMFRELKSRSWMTAGGELLRQEFGPPFKDLVLRRESRANARRFFEK